MVWNMHSLMRAILLGIVNQLDNRARPEDYTLFFCLTDKNNVVVYEVTKTLEDYRQSDVDWIINGIKNFADEDDRVHSSCVDASEINKDPKNWPDDYEF